MSKRFGETAVPLGRSLRHITRGPDTIMTTTITPIAMLLLFVYVFGGAINAGPESYVKYRSSGEIRPRSWRLGRGEQARRLEQPQRASTSHHAPSRP